MPEPVTAEEWQVAVDAAYSMLILHDLIRLGLATGPDVNVTRCQQVLHGGECRGITPRADAIERTFGQTVST